MRLEFVQMLIAQGADINVQTRAGVTPLYMAARMPSRKVVMELLKNGAFRDLCTDRGESPADAARRMGDEDLAKYLAVEKCVRPATRPFQTELPTISNQPRVNYP